MFIKENKEYNIPRKVLIAEINADLGKSYQVDDANILSVDWVDSSESVEVKLKPDVTGNQISNNIIVIPEEEMKAIVEKHLNIQPLNNFNIVRVELEVVDYLKIFTES